MDNPANLIPKILFVIVVIIIIIIVILSFLPVIRRGSTGTVEEKTGSSTLLKSEDGGLNWRPLDQFRGGEVVTLDFDAADSNFLIVGTKGRGVWRGTLNGEDWKQFPGGVGEGAEVFDVINPASEKEFVALVMFNKRGRIIRIKEGERTELFFTPLERYAFLKGYLTRSGILRVIGSDGGFYESRNDGATWRSTSRFKSGLFLAAFDSFREGVVWVADPKGNFYRSTDGGNSWANLTGGLRNFAGAMSPKFIYFDPLSGTLYHGSSYGLLRSSNGGASWRAFNLTAAPESIRVNTIAVNSADSKKIYVAAQNQMYLSEDGGVSWKTVQVGAAGEISNILINPQNRQEIFIGFKNI